MIRPLRLPYPVDALEPFLGAAAVEQHYRDHYLGYVDRVNLLTGGRMSTSAEALRYAESSSPRRNWYGGLSVLPRGVSQAQECDPGDLYQQASQALAHEEFFWGMIPDHSTAPGGFLAQALRGHYGSLDAARRTWIDAATSQFGSGWVWLVARYGGAVPSAQPVVLSLPNANRPSGVVIAVMDVWEHAYYPNYGSDRARWAGVWWDHLCDWDAASARYTRAM